MKSNPDEKCYRVKSDTAYWKYETIRRYLRNEIYTGKLISGKKNRYELGSNKTIAIPKEDWIVADNAVPAIITEDEFIKAQAVIRDTDNNNPPTKKESIFAHKVICGHCGYSLKRGRYGVYSCISSREIEREKCLDGTIREDWLKSKILESYIDTVGSRDFAKQQEQRYEADADVVKARLKKQRQSAQKLKDAKKALFEQLTAGAIDTDLYKVKNAEFTRQLNDAEQAVSELEATINREKQKSQTQPQEPSASVREFSDDMMVCVKSIRVFSTSHAVVDIDLSGAGGRS